MIKKSKHHLKSVNENYLEHMNVAFKVSYNMLYGSLFALIHGLIPDLFQIAQASKLKNFMNLLIKRDNNNNNLII
jgi:hypothetical protein